MRESVVDELNKLLKCDWLQKLAAKADGHEAEVTNENFKEALKNHNALLYILQNGLNNNLKTDKEKELYNNLVYAINASFKNKNKDRMLTLYHHFIDKLDLNETVKLITEHSINMSEYYYYSKILRDKKSVIDILKKSNFGEKHDELLITYFKNFFYEDSMELRMLIYDNPKIYDNLAKIGNKPNFPNEVLKELIYIHGSKYFVSRLHQSLKEDEEFMKYIIIENPLNIFRGKKEKYKQEIRENAFFLFGDKEKGILDIYGMDYIVEKTNLDFLDAKEYLEFVFPIPEFVIDKLDKIVTKEEYTTLLLRGTLDDKAYKKHPFLKTTDIKTLLEYNFAVLDYQYDQLLLKKIVEKYEKMIPKEWSCEAVMRFVNNVAVSYVNGIVEEFDELSISNEQKTGFVINMNIFNKENIEKIGIDNIKKLAYYPNSLYILSQVIKEGNVDIFAKLINNKEENNLAPAIDINVLLYSTYMYKDAIIELINENKLTQENVKEIINITKNNKLLTIRNSSDITNYEENLIKFCDDKIKSCVDTNYAKEILFARLLKTNRANAQDFIIRYKEGLREKNSVNVEILELLQTIDSLTDVDAIKEAYETLKNYPLFKDKTFDEIEGKIKREIIGNSFIKDTNISNDLTNERFNEFCNAWGIKGIIPEKGSNFKILAHVMGAYGQTPDEKSVFESWNIAQRDNISGICTSLITDQHLTTANVKEGAVILGFKDVDPDEILMCAPYDVFSRNARLTPDSKRRQNFIDSDNLPDKCRGAAGSYSEIVISRYINGEKRQPDYIILFDYMEKSDLLSAVVAKEFDIPLVYINTKELFNEQYESWRNELNKYVESPTVEQAIKIIKEGNRIKHGFMSVPKDHIGYEHESMKKLKVKEMAKSLCEIAKEVNHQLSEEEKAKIYEAVREEEEKEKTKHYIENREKTVEKQKEKVSIKMFNEMRKEYGIKESIRIMKAKSLVEAAIAAKEDNLTMKTPLQGGNKFGGK